MTSIRTLAAAGLSSFFFITASSVTAAADVDLDMLDSGTYQGTKWVSGGIGTGEREAMMAEYGDDYNLKLEFAVADGNYIGDVDVRIISSDDTTVMQTMSKHPWLMAQVPAGTYRIIVSGYGRTFEETVQVPLDGMETVVFNAWTKEGLAEVTPGPSY